MKTCTLEIHDEVNVKIRDLDLDERRHLANKYKFELPGARYLPAVRLGRWDGKVSYFSLAGATYINLLPEILEYLDSKGYDVELADTRQYNTKFSFDAVHEQSFAHVAWPAGHPRAGEPIDLRDYQTEVINRFLDNPQSMQCIATGSGKTIMTAVLSQRVEKYGRSVVIVPSKSLVTQTEADYKNLGLDVGVLFGDRKEYTRTHTICTWQSLNSLLKNSKVHKAEVSITEFLEGVVCVIVDEAHVSKADALKTLLTTVFARVPIRWGLTGTIPKEDYAYYSLFCCIGPVIGELSAKELQDAGYLSNCTVNILQLLDSVEYKTYPQELKYLLEDSLRLDYLAKTIAKISESGNTLVLIDRVQPGKTLATKIPNATFISGVTKSSDRKEEYDAFATANDKVAIATYGIAAVGINIPRIFNLVLVEPGKSFVRVIQSIGRGIRRAQDKDTVEIWDITSNCKFSRKHLTVRKKYYDDAKYPYKLSKIDWQRPV